MKRSSFFFRTVLAALTIGAGSVAAHSDAGSFRPAEMALAQAAPAAGAPLTGCGAPTDDEIAASGSAESLGTNALDSARADFDRKAAALDLAARERVARRADTMAAGVPESLVASLLTSCRYAEWAQRRAVPGLSAFSNGTKHWRTAAEMRFFIYVSTAEAAVEARGVGDPALVTNAYAAIAPEIPISSVHGRYYPMRWPT